MNSSSSRAESMKPVILKTGVALIVSATGLILARFMTRREDEQVTTSSASNPESSLPCREEGGGGGETGLMEDSETREENDYEQEILSLRTRLEQIQNKENEMEMSFQNYCNSKDREIMLAELKGMLDLERARLDFFGREVSAMEEENKRIQGMAIVYLKLVERIQYLRSEQGLLRNKAKNLTRRAKELSCIVKEKNARMRGLERMLLKSLEELEMKNKSAIKMEAEVKELQTAIRTLEEKKKGLQSSDTKPEILYEETRNTLEDYRRLLEEHENLKRERADEAKDMVNLKWSNVCLRHALMRYREGDGQENDVSFGGDDNFHHHMSLEDQMALEAAEEERHHEHEERGKHEMSRRKRLMKRLKRWVEGDEKGKAKSEERCFGMHSPLMAEPEEEKPIVLARRSCSSA